MELTPPRAPRIAYGFYPVVAALTLAGIAVALRSDLDRNAVAGVLTVVTLAIAYVVERRHPLRAEWGMSRATLVERDLPFIGLGFVVDQLAQTAIALLAARTIPAGGFGPVGGLQLVLQVVVGLVVFDLCWYAYHRAAHTNERLWRVHGLHHAPSQLYLLMHPVFHPVDLVVSRFVIALVAFRLTGIGPDAAFAVVLVLNLQQTVSHMNVDLRVGPLNQVLIGAETHRFHHSAVDAGNFSAAITLWDKVFGTFVHRPGQVPERLGLADPGDYEAPEEFHRVLAYPFRRGAPGRASA